MNYWFRLFRKTSHAASSNGAVSLRTRFLAASLSLLVIIASCQQPFNLVESLDGPDGIPLSIDPESSQVAYDSNITLSASGGIPPYSYARVTGSGVVDPVTGLYTAPGTTGSIGTTEIVRVTDSYGATADAAVNIVAGSGASALSISPSSIGLFINGTITFTASGGTSPYIYAVTAGDGSVNVSTGAYTAPGTTGTATVTVTDSVGTTDDATVTISDIVTNVDYAVTGVTDTSASTVGGDPLSGQFTLTNIGSAAGTKEVSYDVFVSAGDDVYSADDVLAHTATTVTLAASGTTTETFTGTWPAAAGTYYFIVKVYAGDDIEDLTNNTAWSAGTGVSAPPPPDVDYRVTTASMPAGGATVFTGDTIAESFTIENIGLADGSSTVYWTAYRSINDTLEIGTDTVVDSGSLTFLTTGGTSASQNIDGEWPQTAGSYYLIIDVSASDDLNSANDETVSSADWTVIEPLSISPTTATVQVGGELTFSGSGGVAPYEYFLTTINSGVPTIDQFTGAYMAGNTPTAAGDVIEIRDSSVPQNTTTAIVTVTDIVTNVDYGTVTVTNLGGTVGGGILDGEFTFSNSGSAAGGKTVSYDVYVSSDTSVGVGDYHAASGTTAPLNPGQTSAGVLFAGTWPVISGNYNLIVEVSATDDVSTGDNVGSTPVVISEPNIDYIVTPSSISTVSNPASGGSSIDETFTITNNGSFGGSETVYWTAYISSDTTLDYSADDQPVDAGQISALGAGGVSASISIDNGSWPMVGGATDYYLFVDVSASDEPVMYAGNNSDYATFNITVPVIDYQVVSVTSVNTPADTGTGITESFTFQNSGANDGSTDVFWTAYISDDQILDGGDTPVDTGQEAPLPASTGSTPIPISGTWTVPAGNYYLIVRVSSSDETDSSNNYTASTVFEINSTASEPDYIITDISSAFPTVTTGSAVSETFTIRNSGTLSGTSDITWSAYASSDTVFGSDTFLGSDTVSALSAGASSAPIPINANWTVSSGDYYLFIVVSATDETLETGNNTAYTGPFTVYDPPDYSVAFDSSVPNVGQTDTAISGSPSFTITNGTANGGQNPITWRVYCSDDAVLSGDDTQIDFGTIPAISGSGSSQVFFGGSLPVTGGFYNLIVSAVADDDENPVDNQVSSIPIAVGDQVFIESEPNDALGPVWDPNSNTGLILSPGKTVAFSGTMDAFGGYDMYSFTTDSSTSDLSFLVRWQTGYDDIDFDIYSSGGVALLAEPSQETSVDSEPASLLELTGFSNNTTYYLGIDFWLDADTSGSAGQPYSVLIIAP